MTELEKGLRFVVALTLTILSAIAGFYLGGKLFIDGCILVADSVRANPITILFLLFGMLKIWLSTYVAMFIFAVGAKCSLSIIEPVQHENMQG